MGSQSLQKGSSWISHIEIMSGHMGPHSGMGEEQTQTYHAKSRDGGRHKTRTTWKVKEGRQHLSGSVEGTFP